MSSLSLCTFKIYSKHRYWLTCVVRSVQCRQLSATDETARLPDRLPLPNARRRIASRVRTWELRACLSSIRCSSVLFAVYWYRYLPSSDPLGNVFESRDARESQDGTCLQAGNYLVVKVKKQATAADQKADERHA